MGSEGQLSADFVEEVFGERGVLEGHEVTCGIGSGSRRTWLWHRDQLGKFPEVLGGGSEVEFVAGAVRPA